MNVLQMQFLDVSVKVGIAERGGGGQKEKGIGIVGEVCDSITHNIQFIM